MFWTYFGFIIMCLYAAIVILCWIVFLWHFIKCIRIKKCSDKNCKFHEYCLKYEGQITDKEIESLLNILDKYFPND